MIDELTPTQEAEEILDQLESFMDYFSGYLKANETND